jgi:hypothetical protein
MKVKRCSASRFMIDEMRGCDMQFFKLNHFKSDNPECSGCKWLELREE